MDIVKRTDVGWMDIVKRTDVEWMDIVKRTNVKRMDVEWIDVEQINVEGHMLQNTHELHNDGG
jgi:hypothetical protein